MTPYIVPNRRLGFFTIGELGELFLLSPPESRGYESVGYKFAKFCYDVYSDKLYRLAGVTLLHPWAHCGRSQLSACFRTIDPPSAAYRKFERT